jgi:hypothetical protein
MVSKSSMTSRLSRVLCLVLVFCSQSGSGAAARAQAAEFGFRFEVGDCLTETFDSFTGLFTKELGGEPARSVTARLSLSESQMSTIRQTVDEIRFLDYPSPYWGVPAGLKEVRTFHPAGTYKLEVRVRGVVHTVVWKDAYKPTTEQADRLRDLLSMIIRFVHEQPEFKRLPPSIGGCE